MKTGILGGSFNPVHNGHLEMAIKAAEQFGLDKVLLMVAARPPHKQIEGGAYANVRYGMVCAAIKEKNNSILIPCDLEVRREGASYTVDTLEALKAAHPEDELYLILGEDMIKNFPTWRCPERISELAHIIAVKRIESNDASETDFEGEVQRLKNDYGADVLTADFTVGDISSTDIRRRVKNAEPIVGLVPYSVEKIIYENALYAPADIRYITADLKKRLNERRFEHSIRTMREAILLADRHGADRIKCRLAALLHDCERLSAASSIEQAQKYGVQLDEYEKEFPWLIHAKLGEHMVRVRYGVRDPIVARAVGSHTLGEPNMTDVAMITFLADSTEPARSYPGVEEVRSATARNLKEGMLASIMCMEKNFLQDGKKTHPKTELIKEWLLSEAD